MLRRVTNLCFLKMPVNAVQYRVTVGIFNNQKLISISLYSSLLFYIFLIAFLFSKAYVKCIIIEVIRPVFYDKISQVQKSIKNTKKH